MVSKTGLRDNDLMPGDEYEGEYFDPTDFEFDWPYYEEAIQRKQDGRFNS